MASNRQLEKLLLEMVEILKEHSRLHGKATEAIENVLGLCTSNQDNVILLFNKLIDAGIFKKG